MFLALNMRVKYARSWKFREIFPIPSIYLLWKLISPLACRAELNKTEKIHGAFNRRLKSQSSLDIRQRREVFREQNEWNIHWDYYTRNKEPDLELFDGKFWTNTTRHAVESYSLTLTEGK